MKVATACRECRLGKRKCGEAEPGSPCSPCSKRGLDCSLAAPIRRHPIPIQPPPARASPEAEKPLDPALTKRLVELYLRFIHDKPHTLFHPPSLVRDVERGTLPAHVLYGILSITARFLPDELPDAAKTCHEYFEKAKSCLKDELDELSVENVQCCVLIGNYCGVVGLTQLEALYLGIGLRTAMVMRLPEPKHNDDEIRREVRLRIWWSLYMIDRWGSAGHHLPRQLPDHINDSLQLPMDEVYFNNLQPGSQSEHIDAPRPGLWGRMVQLARVFTKIHDLHRSRVDGNKSHQQTEDSTCDLATELDSWALSLPGHLLPTPENMQMHHQMGLGSAFVALHMGYYHYTNLLYFPFLDLQLEQTEIKAMFADRCKKSAAAFSDFLTLSEQIEGCEVVYFVVAHMTIVSSAALLHVLMFGHESELPETRRRLEANFKALVKLSSYWPAVSLLMERLFTFQRNCMRSTDPNTHKADSWMIGFLLDHARPVAEKVDSPKPPEPATSHLLQRDKVAADTLLILRR